MYLFLYFFLVIQSLIRCFIKCCSLRECSPTLWLAMSDVCKSNNKSPTPTRAYVHVHAQQFFPKCSPALNKAGVVKKLLQNKKYSGAVLSVLVLFDFFFWFVVHFSMTKRCCFVFCFFLTIRVRPWCALVCRVAVVVFVCLVSTSCYYTWLKAVICRNGVCCGCCCGRKKKKRCNKMASFFLWKVREI